MNILCRSVFDGTVIGEGDPSLEFGMTMSLRSTGGGRSGDSQGIADLIDKWLYESPLLPP